MSSLLMSNTPLSPIITHNIISNLLNTPMLPHMIYGCVVWDVIVEALLVRGAGTVQIYSQSSYSCSVTQA